MNCEIKNCPEYGDEYMRNCRRFSGSKSINCKLREDIMALKSRLEKSEKEKTCDCCGKILTPQYYCSICDNDE